MKGVSEIKDAVKNEIKDEVNGRIKDDEKVRGEVKDCQV